MATSRKKPPRAPRVAASGTSRGPTIAAVAVVVILAAVIATFLAIRANQPQETPPISPVSASYQTQVQNGVVSAGRGPTRLDVYEDPLCPSCKAFEAAYGDRITEALNAGRIQVNYHLVNLLEESSQPPGYSSSAGNALLCAAENGAFPSLHKTLYDQQPLEGGQGYSTEQLITLGQQAGAGGGYAACVQSGRYAPVITQNFQQALNNPALAQSSGGSTGFGTPTIQVNGQTVTPGSPELEAALA